MQCTFRSSNLFILSSDGCIKNKSRSTGILPINVQRDKPQKCVYFVLFYYARRNGELP